MTNETNKLLELIQDLKIYLDLRFQILTLDLTEKLAATFASIVSKSLILFFIGSFLFFGSFALAFALGQLVNNIALGFLIVALINLLIALITTLIAKKYIEEPLVNLFIRFLFKNGKEDSNAEN